MPPPAAAQTGAWSRGKGMFHIMYHEQSYWALRHSHLDVDMTFYTSRGKRLSGIRIGLNILVSIFTENASIIL